MNKLNMMGLLIFLAIIPVMSITDAEKSPLTHTSLGGPATQEVERMIKDRKKKIELHKKKLDNNISKIKKSQEKLQNLVEKVLKG